MTLFFKSVTFQNHHNLRGFVFFDPKVTLLREILTTWASYGILQKVTNQEIKYLVKITQDKQEHIFLKSVTFLTKNWNAQKKNRISPPWVTLLSARDKREPNDALTSLILSSLRPYELSGQAIFKKSFMHSFASRFTICQFGFSSIWLMR